MVNKQKKTIFLAGSIVSLFFMFLLFGCNQKGKLVAEAGNARLYENEAYVLAKHFGVDTKNPEAYKAFVKEWCELEIFKEELKEKYPDDWELVRLRSESFGGDLSRFYLEEIALKNELDTLVSPEEIEAFYALHKDEFVLHDYIVKALYLKIPSSLDFKAEKIHQYYLLKNDKDLAKINSYAKLYAENYYFNDSSWIYFEELAEDIPTTRYNVDNIVLNRSKTYFSDEEYTYFINIIDFRLKNEAPPVNFLYDEIKNLIVANRLQELKQTIESKMIKDLKQKHEVIIHL